MKLTLVISNMSRLLQLLLLTFVGSGVCGELKIIGAGWGRTGTMSVKRALERLGHKTYHMEIIDNHNSHAQR